MGRMNDSYTRPTMDKYSIRQAKDEQLACAVYSLESVVVQRIITDPANTGLDQVTCPVNLG